MLKKLVTLFLFFLAQASFAQTPIASPQAYSPEMIQKAIVNYNAKFNESIKTNDQLIAKMIERYKNLYANIRQCNEGTYIYPFPVPNVAIIFQTAVIQKLQNGNCSLNTTSDLSQTNIRSIVVSQCKFNPGQLVLFTDEEAELIMKGNLTLEIYHSPIDKVMKTQCTMTSNGQPVPFF